MRLNSSGYLQLELEQYLEIMKQIEDFSVDKLEGMQYGTSPAEKDFKSAATFGILLILVLCGLHHAAKFVRFS
tara:strand:- start:418 stop:636 length:219 start_codon:yes stop_codon:yes gene_type:complete